MPRKPGGRKRRPRCIEHDRRCPLGGGEWDRAYVAEVGPLIAEAEARGRRLGVSTPTDGGTGANVPAPGAATLSPEWWASEATRCRPATPKDEELLELRFGGVPTRQDRELVALIVEAQATVAQRAAEPPPVVSAPPAPPEPVPAVTEPPAPPRQPLPGNVTPLPRPGPRRDRKRRSRAYSYLPGGDDYDI